MCVRRMSWRCGQAPHLIRKARGCKQDQRRACPRMPRGIVVQQRDLCGCVPDASSQGAARPSHALAKAGALFGGINRSSEICGGHARAEAALSARPFCLPAALQRRAPAASTLPAAVSRSRADRRGPLRTTRRAVTHAARRSPSHGRTSMPTHSSKLWSSAAANTGLAQPLPTSTNRPPRRTPPYSRRICETHELAHAVPRTRGAPHRAPARARRRTLLRLIAVDGQREQFRPRRRSFAPAPRRSQNAHTRSSLFRRLACLSALDTSLSDSYE